MAFFVLREGAFAFSGKKGLEMPFFTLHPNKQRKLTKKCPSSKIKNSAILSSIFLKERLNMQGKVGCAQCIVGATIIVFHAPEQASVKTIQEFKHLMIQPGFLSWMALIIISSLVLIVKAGPRWGKEHMMIYIGVCSLIGSLSVVATQGLGAAIVHNISTGEAQFDNWFIYFVIVFMVVTLLTEINYLNKALNLFNTGNVQDNLTPKCEKVTTTSA